MARSAVDGDGVLQRRFGRALSLMAVAALGVAVIGGMTAFRALPALPGFHDYEGAGRALSVLSIAGALAFLGTVLHTTLIATHRQRRLLYIALAALAVNVTLNASLIPPHSYMGAAWATVVTEIVVLVTSLWAVRSLQLGWPAAALVRTGAAAAVLAGALLVTYSLPPLVQVAVGVVVYAVAVLATGAVSRTELRLFLKPA